MFSRILSNLFKQDELRIIHARRNLKSISNSSIGKIAIARDFAVVLQDNGWELKLIGHNPNFRQLSGITQNQCVKLAAGFDGYMALTDDGRIITGLQAREFECGFEIESLNGVMDVVGCEGHTVALHYDGHVTCIDEPGGYEGPDKFAREVER